jgi:hypothetical protein
MYTYVDTEGLESEPSYGAVQQISSATTSREITVRGFDKGSIGANASVNNPGLLQRKIYRTVGQTSEFFPGANTFYLVKTEDITHSSLPVIADYDYVDTMDDTTLATQSAYAETTKEHKSAITWSQVDKPAEFRLENIRQVFRDDQDSITGMIDDGNGILIFKENSIIKLYHTGASQNWYIRKIWNEHGCDEAKSLIKAGDTIYFRFRDRPYSFTSNTAPKYIGFGKQNTLDDMTVIDAAATDDWLIYACTETTNHYMLVFDRKIETWYQFNFSTSDLTALVVKKYDDFWTPGRLYAIFAKQTYYYNKGDTTDTLGGAISTTLKLPRIQLDGTTLSKLRSISMDFQRVGTSEITLTLETEDGADAAANIVSTIEDLQRIPGFNTKAASAWFDITLAGALFQLEDFRADLKPVRRGVAV